MQPEPWIRRENKFALRGSKACGGFAFSRFLNMLAAINTSSDTLDVYTLVHQDFVYSHSQELTVPLSGMCGMFRPVPMAFSDKDPCLLFVAYGWVQAWDLRARRSAGSLQYNVPHHEPVGVAAHGHHVALSFFSCLFGQPEGHLRIFCQDGKSWRLVKVVADGLRLPQGLRFSLDGQTLAVADTDGLKLVRCNHRRDSGRLKVLVLLADLLPFRCEDWTVKEVHAGPGCLYDVEEVEGGWLLNSYKDDDAERFGKHTCYLMESGGCPLPVPVAQLPGVVRTWAYVPALGLAVVDHGANAIRFWATPDAVAMDAMSAARTQWMGAVFRSFSP